MKSVSIPDQHPLYPRCITDAPRSNPALTDLLPSSGWPISALHDHPRHIPEVITLNIGPIPICMLDYDSRPQMKCNANRQSYEGPVPEMRILEEVEVSFYIYNSSVLKQRFYIWNISKKTNRHKILVFNAREGSNF